MRVLLFSVICFFLIHGPLSAQDLTTPFEINNRRSATYGECIVFYKSLEKFSKLVDIQEAGPSDVSQPIHAVVISAGKDFQPEAVRKSGKAVLMILNGIHPGEPDGIDASMIFARELVRDPKASELLKNLCLVIIPVYNIGGSLLRNNTSRANQNGPDEYGFRGNGQYLDLNRDFIKCDSRNAETLTKLFRYWDPDVFLDTHCTNGADYPYLMTLITSQQQKLLKPLGQYVHKTLLPELLSLLKKDGLEVCPYVLAHGDPSKGIYDFLDSPRYSSGFAALHHSIGFVSESHMLKPHHARVSAQKILMQNLARLVAGSKIQILEHRRKSRENYQQQSECVLQWKIQKDQADSLWFQGYEAETKTSEVTGLERLYYNPVKHYYRKIPYFNYAPASLKVAMPDAYILPACYHEVVDRLIWNGVRLEALQKDTMVEAEFYRIADFKTPSQPYENHYLHSEVQVETVRMTRAYFKGDYLIRTRQPAARFLVETLEPQAPDSYFAWNFFDGILQRKEYFSDYLFEDLAREILYQNAALKADFEKKKAEDPEFAKNAGAMLEWIYLRSPYSEPGYRIYPVARCTGL